MLTKNAFFAVYATTAMTLLSGCADDQPKHIDIQGHRGARAHYPENSLTGFAYAATLPVGTLELDLVCNENGDVIVSHEPWFNPDICLGPDGDKLADPLNLFPLDLQTIQRCDCGSLGNPRFPQQRKMRTFKPTLAQVVDKVNSVPRPAGMPPVRFNAEIKHDATLVGTHFPAAAEAARLILAEVTRLGIADRTTIQSFSAEVMEAVHAQAPDIQTAWLMEDEITVEEALSRLSFLPAIYSPYHKLLTAEEVERAHAAEVAVIPWTVNDPERMAELLAWGVDGLITDDPGLALNALVDRR